MTDEMHYPVDNIDYTYKVCHPDIPLQANDERYFDLTPIHSDQSGNHRNQE